MHGICQGKEITKRNETYSQEMAELVAKAVMRRVRAARKSGQEEHGGGASGRLAGGSGGGNEESTKAGELEVEPRSKRENAAAEAYYDFLKEYQE